MSPPGSKPVDTIVEGEGQDLSQTKKVHPVAKTTAAELKIWQKEESRRTAGSFGRFFEDSHSSKPAVKPAPHGSPERVAEGAAEHTFEHAFDRTFEYLASPIKKGPNNTFNGIPNRPPTRPADRSQDKLVASPSLARYERAPNETTLEDLQKKLIKKVASIEDFIKFKLKAAVTDAAKNQRDSAQEKQSESSWLSKLAITPKPVIEAVTPQQFAQKAENLFDRLDVNKIDSLTKADLARALQNPKFKGQDAQVLAAIYGNYDRLISSTGDNFSGLSKTDLTNYGQIQKQYDREYEFALKLSAKADDPDSYVMRTLGSGDGQYITQDRLCDAWNNAPMRQEDRKLVQSMLTHYDAIANAQGDRYFFAKHGISIDDMRAFASKVLASDEYETVINVNFIMKRTNESQNSSNDLLFADRIDPIKNITPDAIKQGTIGDCYFEAAVASVAKSNPASIKNMIKDNMDGSFTVTFPGALDEPVTVTAPTEAECGLFNTGSPSGIWATVLEKAHGLYRQQHFWRRNVFGNLTGGESPTEGADGGGFGNGLSLLTGNEVEMHILSLEDRDELRNCLNVALNSLTPKAVITFTGPNVPGYRKTNANFSRGHVHSIIAYNPFGPDGGTLTIRNPWGYNDTSTSGTIKISFDQYTDNFCGFFAEQ